MKARAAYGAARMKGTSMSVAGVEGRAKKLGDCRARGRTEKRVKSRVRPIASGIDSSSSRVRVGLAGMGLRSEVRVCKISTDEL